MRWYAWLLALVGALVGVGAPTRADEKGGAVLRQAFKTLHAAKTYTANIAVDAKLPNRTLNQTGTVAAMKPNFLRVELKGIPAMSFVADGKAYHVQVGDRYQKQPLDPAPTEFAGQWEGEIDAFFGGEKGLTGREISLVGTEKVDGVECDQVKVAGNDRNPTVVYAVGKADHLIRRATMTLPSPDGASITQTNTLTAIKLNAPKTAKQFTFTPPPDKAR